MHGLCLVGASFSSACRRGRVERRETEESPPRSSLFPLLFFSPFPSFLPFPSFFSFFSEGDSAEVRRGVSVSGGNFSFQNGWVD